MSPAPGRPRRTGAQEADFGPWRGSGRPEALKQHSGATIGCQTLVLDDFPDPALARALSPNGRAHWAAKRKAREMVEWVVGIAICEQRLTDELLGERVRITYRWIVPDRRRRDLDNHTTGVVKVVQDCLVRLGMIDADDSSCVVDVATEIMYERGSRRLEVTIEPSGERG